MEYSISELRTYTNTDDGCNQLIVTGCTNQNCLEYDDDHLNEDSLCITNLILGCELIILMLFSGI